MSTSSAEECRAHGRKSQVDVLLLIQFQPIILVAVFQIIQIKVQKNKIK